MRSGIHEGSEDEFGDMAGGAGEGRVASPLLKRALDDCLQATQGTPMTMEAEIARRTEVEVVRRMAVFQRQLMGGHHEQGEDPQVFFTGTGREA